MKIQNAISYFKKPAALLGIAAAASALLCVPAHAHFLWGEIATSPTLQYRLTFSDDGVSKTSADLLQKITQATAWTEEGKVLRLTAADGTLNAVIPASAGVIGARQTWGVYGGAPKLGVFLLRYDAKAAAREADAAHDANLPVEVFVHRGGGDFVAHVAEKARPASGAEVWVDAPGLSAPLTLTADADGDARFAASQSGECLIRAMVADNGSGTYQGRHYDLIRNYSTLTFPIAASPALARPAALTQSASGGDPQADPAAYALLKDAHDHRQTFSPGFPGLAADISFNDNGKTYAGTISSDADDDVAVDIPNLAGDDSVWVKDQLENLVGHRRGGDFADSDEGSDPITFGPDDHSPLGREVVLHDGMASSYRVKDHQLIDVTRTMMGRKFSITVLESIKTDAGKYLPSQFMVTYFDPKSDGIDHVDAYTDTYAEVGGEWLPSSRRVITAKDGGFETRIITLGGLRIVAKK